MTRCCGHCRSVPGVCALRRSCRCHWEPPEDITTLSPRNRHPPIPENTQRAILAAQCGADGAVAVALDHGVPVGAVFDIWRTAKRGD